MLNVDPFALIVLFVGMSLLPFAAMVATCYLKIVVVMSLIRNALGVQSIPPNMVINALALILTFYVMAPIAGRSWDLLQEGLKDGEVGVFLETAHPAKFKSTVDGIINGDIEIPAKLAAFMKGTKQSIAMTKDFADFKAFLMKQ